MFRGGVHHPSSSGEGFMMETLQERQERAEAKLLFINKPLARTDSGSQENSINDFLGPYPQ